MKITVKKYTTFDELEVMILDMQEEISRIKKENQALAEQLKQLINSLKEYE